MFAHFLTNPSLPFASPPTRFQKEMEDLVINRQVAIIGVITLISTVSVAAGIKKCDDCDPWKSQLAAGVNEYGIKKCSQLAVILTSLVWLCLLFLGDTAYILNVLTEATGPSWVMSDELRVTSYGIPTLV